MRPFFMSGEKSSETVETRAMSEEEKAVEQQDDISIGDTGVTLDGGEQLVGDEVNEEVEIVLAGQEDSPSDEAASKPDNRDYILRRMQKKRDKVEQENLELKLKLAANSSRSDNAEPPTLEQCEYDDTRFQSELSKWQAVQQESSVRRIIQEQQEGHRLVAAEQGKQQALETYAENASKLGVLDFNESQDKAMDILGDDFSELLAVQLPVDSPKLMYWFGKNPKEAEKYRDLYQSNPGGATFELGKLAAKLTVKRKHSSAASPERKIDASGVPGGNSDFQKRYQEIDKQLDSGKLSIQQGVNKVLELKQEARKAGFDVAQLK